MRNINVDGACFGTSFPHVFLQHYPNAVILPPKVYLYEPSIYGFKIYGKRGSKYFKPPQNGVKDTSIVFPDEAEKERRRNMVVQKVISSMATASRPTPSKMPKAASPDKHQATKGKLF